MTITKKFLKDTIEYESELSFGSKLTITKEMFQESKFDIEKHIKETLFNSLKEDIYCNFDKKIDELCYRLYSVGDQESINEIQNIVKELKNISECFSNKIKGEDFDIH